jgi:hypothetical protein
MSCQLFTASSCGCRRRLVSATTRRSRPEQARGFDPGVDHLRVVLREQCLVRVEVSLGQRQEDPLPCSNRDVRQILESLGELRATIVLHHLVQRREAIGLNLRRVLLVRNRPLKRQHGGAHQIAAFEEALYPSERFYLYTVEPIADR